MTIAALLIALIATTSPEAEGEPTLLDFHASWCGPCQKMRPAVEQLVRKGYPVKSVDIDDSPELAERYRVSAVPTFIVIDREGRSLARTAGFQPAADLARLYNEARVKASPRAPAKTRVVSADDDDAPDEAGASDDEPEDEAGSRRPAFANPKPWETGVRIKVQGHGMMGFGSGTIIHSTPQESVILTCAHIFKVEGRRQQYAPAQFPNAVSVDLFDGQLRGTRPAQVHYSGESYPAEVIDYDFNMDVGLIRIRPGRRLKASRVVPAYWVPKARMQLITVGCSEGHDATAWNTQIINPGMHGLQGNNVYEAIECWIAPKQGRSGGGLYTSDGYVAGVCDFAEPRGNHGLYASPRSIHRILDRNRLTALYVPVDQLKGGALLADANSRPKPGPKRPSSGYARAQSPDHEEGDVVTIPPPEMLGIKTPRLADDGTTRTTARKSPWRAPAASNVSLTSAASAVSEEPAETTDLKLPPSVDSDHFASTDDETVDRPETADQPKPSRKPTRASKWRPVNENTSPSRED